MKKFNKEVNFLTFKRSKCNRICNCLKLQTDLGGEILEDGGEVDRGATADAFGVLAGFEETGDTADGELETGFAAPRCALLGGACGERFASSGHWRK